MSLPALLFPVYNPDLFWHLSAGRWMLLHRAVPTADFLSLTRAGRPWLDFEWLPQVGLQLEYLAAGLGGVWLLKCAVMALCLLALRRALPKGPLGYGLLGLWAVSAIAHSDARPELLSLLLLVALLERLERRRRGGPEVGGPIVRSLAVGGLFAFWANAHAAFVLGWAALGVYAVELLVRGRRERARWTLIELGLAVGATVFNPYGLGPHLVSWRHWREGADLSVGISEWRPMDFANPLHLPFWALAGLLAAAAGLALAKRRKSFPWAPFAFALALVCATLRHERFFIFADAAAAVALGALLEGVFSDKTAARASAGALAVCAAFLLWVLPKTDWKGPLNPKFVPVRLTEFVGAQREVFERARLFNQWEWGGYLGWKLPWLKVFADGRYIFHDLIPVMRAASQEPGTWSQFLKDQGLTAAAVPNRDMPQRSVRRYPDGSQKEFLRPWYLSYFPREDWALVYWDEQSLLLVRRDAAPADWVSAHEYRLVRPRDDAAFKDALARNELDLERLAQERFRHDRELDVARRCRWSDACSWRPY